MTFKRCAVVFICLLVSLSAQFENFFRLEWQADHTEPVFALKNKRRCIILSNSIHLQSHNWWMEKKAGSQDAFWKTQWSCLRRGTVGKDIQCRTDCTLHLSFMIGPKQSSYVSGGKVTSMLPSIGKSSKHNCCKIKYRWFLYSYIYIFNCRVSQLKTKQTKKQRREYSSGYTGHICSERKN